MSFFRGVDSKGRHVCTLCHRRFATIEKLERHENESERHATNLLQMDYWRHTRPCRPAQHAPPPFKKARTEERLAPDLSPELVGRIASYATHGDDIMNICLSVGPEDARIIRHAYLRDNSKYLRHTLTKYVSSNGSDALKIKCRSNILAWMQINAGWRSICTPDSIKELSIATVEDGESDTRRSNVNHAIIFNNPSVAIELGLIDVLKHLVEKEGIGERINELEWNNFSSPRRTHLLAVAMTEADMPSIDYLLTVEGIDMNSRVFRDDPNDDMLIHHISNDDSINAAFFEKMIRHRSFDVNAYQNLRGRMLLPLHVVLVRFMRPDGGSESAVEKVKVLLRAGANPWKYIEDSLPPPILCAKHLTGDSKLMIEVIALMETYAFT